jgi:hypothetical protein
VRLCAPLCASLRPALTIARGEVCALLCGSMRSLLGAMTVTRVTKRHDAYQDW